jgi:murein DD-endopeptidase MepM/ murein hydrolase activator NlpD
METFSRAVLILIGMVLFANYKNGTLGDWLKAKFFNAGSPLTPGGGDWAASGLGLGAANKDGVVMTGLGGGVGTLLAPVAGGVTSPFGADRGDHAHAGIDYGVPQGTPVVAARAGRVTFAGPSGEYGLRVDLDHGAGTTTRYAHLSRIAVHLGDTVRAGQTIGSSGNTGQSTGPHLHFELRQGGVAVNPAGSLSTVVVA